LKENPEELSVTENGWNYKKKIEFFLKESSERDSIPFDKIDLQQNVLRIGVKRDRPVMKKPKVAAYVPKRREMGKANKRPNC
jgi:hypothetical protein